MERSVDVETFLAIEEENLLTQFRKKLEPAKPAFDVDAFFKNLSKKTPPVENAANTEPAKITLPPYNPYTQKGIGQLENKTTVPDKKSGLMGWVEENPGTAILGSLLLAGAAYLLYDRYGRKKKPAENGEQEESQLTASGGRGKRKTRRLTTLDKKKEENSVNGIAEETAENNDAPEAAKEQPGALKMAAGAAGGVIAGKILPKCRIFGVIATGAYAISRSDITMACIAAGLFFSPLIFETVQGLIESFAGSTMEKGKEKTSSETSKEVIRNTSVAAEQEPTLPTQANQDKENIGEISSPYPNKSDTPSESISENQPSDIKSQNDLIESLKR